MSAYLSLIGRRRGWALIRGWAFSAFRMGPYSRWTLIRGWALIRINTVTQALTLRVITRVNMRPYGAKFRSVNLLENGNKNDETYHVASCCCP